MCQESGHDSAGCLCLKVSRRLDELARAAVSPEGSIGRSHIFRIQLILGSWLEATLSFLTLGSYKGELKTAELH